MGRHTRFRSSVAAAAFMSLSCTASAEEATRPGFAVLAYNFASVPHDTMRRASEKVTRIYREAGVDVEWIDPLAEQPASRVNPPSNSPQTFTVQMMIRPKRVSGGRSTSDPVMGVALDTNEHGGTTSLFYDQVLRVARKFNQPLADILAIAMAHEIGHLLLPLPGHSPTGIMRPDWDGRDLRHAVLGSLAFTSAQAALIRSKVAGCCSLVEK